MFYVQVEKKRNSKQRSNLSESSGLNIFLSFTLFCVFFTFIHLMVCFAGSLILTLSDCPLRIGRDEKWHPDGGKLSLLAQGGSAVRNYRILYYIGLRVLYRGGKKGGKQIMPKGRICACRPTESIMFSDHFLAS